MENNSIGKPNKNILPTPTSNAAFTIVNNLGNTVSYFYSSLNNNGQNRWYQHDIASKLTTWDWSWSNYNPDNCMEIQIHLEKNRYCFVVFVYQGTDFNETGDNYSKYDVYYTYTKDNKNPEWNKPIWNKISANVYNQDLINFHGLITINENEMIIFSDGLDSNSILFYI